jgi:hypothetical protein
VGNATSPQNTNTRDLDPLVASDGASVVKRAVRKITQTGSILAGDLAVATHVDDAAFVPGTDGLVVIGGQADETATDSVDEGDAGALRMTLNRRLITAGHLLDDGAFGIGTDYVNPAGFLVDETSSDSADEGDVGLPRMTADRQIRTAPAAGTITNRSLAITTGGTAQQLMAANVARKYLLIQNQHATESIFFNFTTTAVADSPSVEIKAGVTYEMYGGFVSTEAISVIAATTGHKVIAKEG